MDYRGYEPHTDEELEGVMLDNYPHFDSVATSALPQDLADNLVAVGRLRATAARLLCEKRDNQRDKAGQ